MTAIILTKRLRRVIRLILLITTIIILQSSSTGTVFSKTPLSTARWETTSPDNNHLGSPIEATLRITTQPGVTVDTSKLPGKGDILPLPPKLDTSTVDTSIEGYRLHNNIPPEIPEGELEVISYQISQYSENDQVVTVIDYKLQYLLPLTSPTDDKRLPWDASVYQRYLQFSASTSKVESVTTKIFVETTNVYIVPRVDENSRPIFKFFKLPPSASGWPYVRLAGAGLVALAFVFPAWRIGSLIKANRRQREGQIANAPPTAGKLYLSWCENPDPAIFIEALKLYRRGIWGRPQASTWITTTFILYSGVPLNQEQAKSVFARLVKEVGDELPT